jgi:hypothetical protein
VVIYEAVFNLTDFIRTDIIVKKEIQLLIEVKAKSFNRRMRIYLLAKWWPVSGWKPYLFDWLFKIRGTENLSIQV